jgi:hypothetical protein
MGRDVPVEGSIRIRFREEEEDEGGGGVDEVGDEFEVFELTNRPPMKGL